MKKKRRVHNLSLLPDSMTVSLKGSLTIEASLVIPIFIFSMFLIISVLNLLRFHIILNEAIHQETKKMAMETYTTDSFSIDYVKNSILEHLNGLEESRIPVKDGIHGIDFSGSDLSNREILYIRADYQALLPYDFFDLFNYHFSSKCVMHTFTGYINGLYAGASGPIETEYVYITATGTVYHKNRDCSYLRISVSETTKDQINNIRNSSGHKYYPCAKCNARNCNRLYITEDGTSYHGSLGCSGLKRTVMCVPLSRVSGRRACSRCGH